MTDEITVRIPARPSRFRLALAMLLPIYPLVTALLYIIMPLTADWPLWERTLLLAPLMVFSIVYVISPIVQRHLAWFIVPRAKAAP